MSCTPEALVCDDAGTSTDVGLLLAQVAVAALVLGLVVLLVVRLLRRARARRAPVTRVWISASGDVVQRRL